jgi:hypothetical protein
MVSLSMALTNSGDIEALLGYIVAVIPLSAARTTPSDDL